jgi:hypothetical protein
MRAARSRRSRAKNARALSGFPSARKSAANLELKQRARRVKRVVFSRFHTEGSTQKMRADRSSLDDEPARLLMAPTVAQRQSYIITSQLTFAGLDKWLSLLTVERAESATPQFRLVALVNVASNLGTPDALSEARSQNSLLGSAGTADPGVGRICAYSCLRAGSRLRAGSPRSRGLEQSSSRRQGQAARANLPASSRPPVSVAWPVASRR